ncbi:MAG: AraC family transcriptional regulator [Demequinaceae bacterium]|nr:AraC family transcriptional regulator [Demequinaceae bacterium]
MTGYDHIVRAIEAFEDSLVAESPEVPIQTVAELARRVGYSVHHFARLFSAVVGTPPKEYILGRTLTEAARVITGGETPLRAVAERFGFRDYETFSRAFRKRFGIPPKRLRQDPHPLDGTPRAVPARPRLSARPVIAEPGLVHIDEFHVTGLAFFVEEGVLSLHSPWEAFMRVQDRVRDRVLPEAFFQVSSWPETDALTGLAVLCGIRTDGVVEQEPLFHTRTIPAATCLRFVHPGGIETIRDTYEFIYRDYLATHDVQAAASWEYQHYTREGATEIYIPVRT